MTTEDEVRKWMNEKVLEGKPISSIDPISRNNVRNLLAGFLQACEIFGKLNHEQAEALFNELGF